MKKIILLSVLFILIHVFVVSCSSDDEEFPKLNESDRIGTVTDSGYMAYNKDSKRWVIISLQSKCHYHPLNLPKKYKQMWKKVNFTGYIYPYVETSKQENIPLPIAGHSWYFIEIKHIEEYN